MHRSVLSELYMSLKKITHVLIALILNEAMLKPAKISLNSPAHKEYKNLLFDVHRFNKTKVTGTYLRCSIEIKYFIMISLMKQNLFLVTLIDIGIKLLASIDECNKPNPIFVICFSPKIWLIV